MLETLDGLASCRASNPSVIDLPDWNLDDLTRLCNQTALEMVTEPIVFLAAQTSRLIHVNRAACHCLGYTRQQVRNLSLLDIAPQATRSSLTELFGRAMGSTNQETRVRTVYRHRNGSMIPVRCCIRALSTMPDWVMVAVGKNCASAVGVRAGRMAGSFRDSLTFLPNREWLWQRLDREVRAARQRDYQFAVLFIDIDCFKDINDSYGHLAGDQVLQAVARRLTESVRPSDAVTRYGGDEFVVLLTDVRGDDDVRRIVERIGGCLEAIGQRRAANEWRTHVTVSIGAAISGGQGESSVDVVERADRAMYRAKALGRNGRFVIDEVPRIPAD
jgi:diguanylate cyclase (GGDEF)-like protein/PAS domain S-box-containing protein